MENLGDGRIGGPSVTLVTSIFQRRVKTKLHGYPRGELSDPKTERKQGQNH
jgi:hypothetical protein